MKHVDEKVLEAARKRPRCEWCGRRRPLDAAHIMSKGAGRVDIDGNVVGLCRLCHRRNHAGTDPTTADLLAVAAAREKCLQDDIVREVYRIRQLPKGSEL